MGRVELLEPVPAELGDACRVAAAAVAVGVARAQVRQQLLPEQRLGVRVGAFHLVEDNTLDDERRGGVLKEM